MPDFKTNKKNNEKTRIKILEEQKSELKNMPEIEYGEWIIEYLLEIGPAQSFGMGLSPISFYDIYSWSKITGTHINHWDAISIKKLSKIYVSQYSISSEKECPAPYFNITKPIEEQRENVSSRFKKLALMRQKKR